MIDLNKLNSQFDINNLDANQITKLLAEHQKAFAIAFFIISLLIAGGMFKDHHAKELAISARLTQEQGKFDVIKAREKAIQDLADFNSSIPKPINVFDLITLIQNYAKPYNTSVSYTPSQSRDVGLYDIINVTFSGVSDNFKDTMLFLRKIEKSNFPIMVSAWSGHEEGDGKIIFTIVISAVLIHP